MLLPKPPHRLASKIHQPHSAKSCVADVRVLEPNTRQLTFPLTLSDISSIDHLALREFVSGPPRYHLAIKGVREQFVIVEQNSGP